MAIIKSTEVLDFTKIKLTSDDINEIIPNIIGRVQSDMESFCNRKFESDTYTEYHDGMGVMKLFPNQYPITNITSIHDDSDWIWDTTSLLASANYRIANDNHVVFKSDILSNDEQNIKIIYTAGYITIPENLKQACIKEVGREYRHRKNYDLTAKSDSDGNVTYVEKGFLASTKRVLSHYRKQDVV